MKDKPQELFRVVCKEYASDPMTLSTAKEAQEIWNKEAFCRLEHEIIPYVAPGRKKKDATNQS